MSLLAQSWTLPAALSALLCLLPSTPVQAFAVSSGFSEPCHEHITGEAYQDVVLDMSTPWIVVPSGGAWRKLSNYFLADMGLNPATVDDGLRFILISLIMGVRAPDTDGHAMANIESLRRIHGDPKPEGQYAHSLRGPDDDYAAGDVQAVAGTRKKILDLVAQGQSYLYLPAQEQVIKVEGYLDFYGRFDVQVYAPLYFVGQAAHALQDTFSHTLRSDQHALRKIVHVVTYIDAISDHHKESRDGLAHSAAMDNCFRTDMEELRLIAIEATIDFLIAIRQQFNGWDPQAVEQVLDKWVTLQEGCTRENHFCDNERWERLARKDQTGPYVEEIFGCSCFQATELDPPPCSTLLFWIILAAWCGLRILGRKPSQAR